MCASDIIAPTTVEPFSIKGLELLFSQITQVKGSARGIRTIIPTMYDPRARQSSDLLAELHRRYGALMGPPVRVNVRLSEAPAAGRTIYEYDPRSRGAVDYALLVEHISTVFGFQAAKDRRPTTDDHQDAVSAASPSAPNASRLAGAHASARPPECCPNCGRPLKFATLAGYRVAYCDHCRYKSQTLVGGPRR
jgi:chromosome partitioning protein